MYATKIFIDIGKNRNIRKVTILHPQQRSHMCMSLYSLIYIYLQRHSQFSYKMTGLLLFEMCYMFFFIFYGNKQSQAFFLHFIFCSVLFGQVLCASYLSPLISFSFIFLDPMPSSSNCSQY